MKDVVIIGGGLSGLINAILLNRAGWTVTLYEKKKYPFHRVCGEYVSNEVIPFLKEHQLFPYELEPAKIEQFRLTSINNHTLEMPLDLGGFGISRYQLDQWLANIGRNEGVEIKEKHKVLELRFMGEGFQIKTNQEENKARYVIGAFGKRSELDKKLDRSFIKKRSPYLGVKYHIRTDTIPPDNVELHNFPQGYCGASRVEENKYNLCYLSHRSNLKSDLKTMEEEVLYRNPALKNIFLHSEFLFEKPEVINEISFAPKEPVEGHVLMSGDAAGMITPLCGNGMAMAIHAAKLLSETLINHHRQGRIEVEKRYQQLWNHHFARRHWAGRQIQRLFGKQMVSEVSVRIAQKSRPLARFLMEKTHGVPFQ